MTEKFTLGRIPFLVCCPFFHKEIGSPSFEFKEGSPAQCNSWLSQGLIHAAPSSSIEYAKNPDQYLISPHYCTGSKQSVGSVLLLSQVPWQDIQSVDLTQQSDTSVCLLDILLSIYRGQSAQLTRHHLIEDSKPHAQLLIGDQALQARHQGDWPYVYDLAELWHQWQGLPFIFGLWIFRKEHLQEGQRWHQQLEQSLAEFESDPLAVSQHWAKSHPHQLDEVQTMEYFNNLNYRLSPEGIESLERFYSLAQELGYIEHVPDFTFIEV